VTTSQLNKQNGIREGSFVGIKKMPLMQAQEYRYLFDWNNFKITGFDNQHTTRLKERGASWTLNAPDAGSG